MRALFAAVLAALLLSAPAALAAPHVEFAKPMPGVQTNGQLVAGPDGNIWVALHDAVARVTPDGTVTEFTATDFDKLGSPAGGITAAAGAVWISQPPVGVQSILKITPGNPPVATSFAVTDIDAGATAMALGPDGNIWVGVPGKLVKFPPSNPTASTPFTFAGLQPKCMTASPDGTLWVADSNSQALLNITTAGTLVHAAYPTGSAPQCLAAGSAGQVTVGLPVNSPQQIGRLTPGGSVQAIDRPNGSDPFGVAFGADGAFWVAEFAGNRLARVTTDGRLTALTGFPTNISARGPRQITVGPDHTLWATLDSPGDETLSQIAKVSGVEPAGGGTPPDITAPRVTASRLSRSKVRARTRAITLRFGSNEAGSATIVISRRLPGRRKGTACVKPTHKLRKAKRCTRLKRVKTIRAVVTAGANAVRIRIKALPAGSYSVALTVADSKGNRAARVTRRLTIKKRR